MPNYFIYDAKGIKLNSIEATEDFVKKHYKYYKLESEVEPTGDELLAFKQTEARRWRNDELFRTDILAVLPDYPEAEALLAYRQALRDWTDTEDFPETRPVMGG